MRICYYPALAPREYALVMQTVAVDDFGNEVSICDFGIYAFGAALDFVPDAHTDHMCGEH
jgi:hypothetical protein